MGLQRLGVRCDRLYHSPWLRAVETAALLGPVLAGEAVCSPALARPPSQACSMPCWVSGGPGGPSTLGGELVTWLTTGTPPDGSGFAFKRGGVAWLEGSRNRGVWCCEPFCLQRCCGPWERRHHGDVSACFSR